MKRSTLLLIIFLFNLSATYAQNDNWKKIETAFIKLDSLNNELGNCHFEFKNLENSFTPDVDTFDVNYTQVLDEITKDNVVKLIDYYAKHCENLRSDSLQKNQFRDKIIDFLEFEVYSIQLDYKVSDGKTENLICLIYHENIQFILFWIRTSGK